MKPSNSINYEEIRGSLTTTKKAQNPLDQLIQTLCVPFYLTNGAG